MKLFVLIALFSIASQSLAAPIESRGLAGEKESITFDQHERFTQTNRRRQIPQPSPIYSNVPQFTPVQYYTGPMPSRTPVPYITVNQPTNERNPDSGIELGDDDGSIQSQQDTITPLTTFPDTESSPNDPVSSDTPVTGYLSPEYIDNNPNSTLPGPNGRVTMRANLAFDFLSGPCGSKVYLSSDGVLHLYNAGGANVGQFTGAYGACDQMSRVPCVMRFEAGSLNIGNYARGEFHDPKFSTNSNGIMAIVVETGDIWIIRENGVAEVKILMNSTNDICSI
ncbi:hypothetical protein SARC_02768 [Sphaeroforma arctica JP610]|uniref:Uncharacterized protein n=1 Tax=Sphaeroforma arctica JP610 TaxID=667725 RepID=A0A0L0G9W4_9EUKA|nr:hypothetical protein SARC_02768 [Sphaeroforma arctica JP610]KNC85043.1 hypothetical protein SARC_02768 [Sphaeroforma arctica JP610]|eukprot:XP_014158945.1 hypothetical protein SARC_02768 [Sphaeroforma arctica JP610]